MTGYLNVGFLAYAVGKIERAEPEDRLQTLLDLARDHGGRWDLPSAQLNSNGEPAYMPFPISVQVFGAYAMAEELHELAQNWVKVARNQLNGAADQVEDAA